MNQKELSILKSQLKQGNNDYLKFLFEQHGPYCISNIIRKFNCSLEDAEDLLIDAILNFRDKAISDKLSYLSSVRNYLYTTCINMKKEKDYYTFKKREKEAEVTLFLYDEEDELSEYNSELLQLSLESFKKLSESCQRILRLFYIQHNSMTEVAKKLGLANANSAKVKKARCHKKWLEIVKKK